MPDPKKGNHNEDRSLPVSKSEAAKTSSAKSRINIPFNLDNWKELPAEYLPALSWFHQHLLEEKLSYKHAEQAIDYDKSTIYRVLHGTYAGAWEKVIAKINGYRKLATERRNIQHAEFVETDVTRLITGGLSYALQNNVITTIVGESRMGKTVTAKYWRDQNNHGRTVFVTAPPYGGTKSLLRGIAFCLGINRNTSIPVMLESIYKAFNKNRMLIVDEAHRLLPCNNTANPVQLEILRDIHDQTHCGLALLSTERFSENLSKSTYQFEQILGRIELPVRLPREFRAADIAPIVGQFIERPSKQLNAELLKIANDLGRLGILLGTLKVASKIASKRECELGSEHVFEAIKLRHQMMGETIYAKK